MKEVIEALRILISLAFFIYSSWSDYKTREVSNNVWILFAPPAIALTLTELFIFDLDFLAMQLYGLCFGLTTAFALILFYSGGFGGADAKALMCLALALPFYPRELLAPLSGEISPIMQQFFPITVFNNSVLLAALTAVYILIYNLIWRIRTGKTLFEGEQRNEPIGKKMLILITGYKISVKRIKEKWHIYPLEDVEKTEGKTKRKLVVLPKDEGRNAIVERLESAAETGEIQDAVWASPGLPMLIFMTAGLIITLFYGDIIWTCINFVL